MNSRFRVTVAIIILLLVAPSICGQSAVAQESISGTHGVATQRAVVNFDDIAHQEALSTPTPRTKPKVIPPPMPVPGDLPVPHEMIMPPEAEPWRAQPEAGPPSVPYSPAPSSSFLALEDDNTAIPPDTQGAVGPNHLMVTLNTQVRIQDRAGGVISTVSLDSFWASVGPFTAGVFDPRVLYDPYGSRWIFTAPADFQSPSSSLLIGVTQTDDPTGAWNLYRVDVDSSDSVWADYPSVGFNKDWIVVQVNMYNISDDEFNRSHIYVFQKADLYAGGAGNFTLISKATIGGTQVPAVTHDSTLSTLYLLQEWNSNYLGTGYLRLYALAGPVGSEVLTAVAYPSTPNPWDFMPPGGEDFAPQLDSAQKIQTNDSRMHNVVYRNGSVWGVHTVFLPAGGSPTRSSIQWWQLDTAGAVIQRARIDDTTSNTFYAFPSIAVNKDNDVLMGYSRFSATQYASANYSFRVASDALNTLQADTVLKAGEAPYYKTYGGDQNRWGDYSNTVVDPVNDTDMWTIQEYAATPSEGVDRWGTWWGRIVAIPTVSISTDRSAYRAGDRMTVTVTTNPNGSTASWCLVTVLVTPTTTTPDNPFLIYTFDPTQQFMTLTEALSGTVDELCARPIGPVTAESLVIFDMTLPPSITVPGGFPPGTYAWGTTFFAPDLSKNGNVAVAVYTYDEGVPTVGITATDSSAAPALGVRPR